MLGDRLEWEYRECRVQDHGEAGEPGGRAGLVQPARRELALLDRQVAGQFVM